MTQAELEKMARDKRAKGQTLIDEANQLEIDALKLERGIDVGMRVKVRGRVCEIVSFSTRYDTPRVNGKWVLKDGTLGKEHREISTYSWDVIEVVK